MNLHSPERQPNESQAQYIERRALSNALVAQALKPTNPPHFAVPIGKSANSKRDKHRAKVAAAKPMAAGPKPLPVRKHKRSEAIKPTWPRSDDQHAQTRPLIVLGKNRERDAGKREKPKSAVAKRMDRPERVALIDRGNTKIMRWFGVAL